MATPVIFRKWPKKEGGDVIALFPTLVGNMDPYTCMSYMQLGQHSSADPQEVVQATEPAKPAEYADLLAELKSVGYDDLVVYKKLLYRFLDERRRSLAEYLQPASPTKRRKKSKSKGRSSCRTLPSLRGVR